MNPRRLAFPALLFAATCLAVGATAAPEKKEPAFHDDFDKARAESAESGKPVIAIFSASWCPPCQQMKREIYPSKEAQPFHDSFVWAYLDADAPANRPLMSQFGVSGIPHVAFVGKDGKILSHFAGALPAPEFAKVLTQVLESANGAAASAPTQGSGAKKGSASKR